MQVAYFSFDKNNDKSILNCLNDYCLFKDFKIVIENYFNEKNFFESFQQKKYRIVFFNISSDDKKCIEVAKKIRELDNNTAIIFLADSTEFAYDAFLLYSSDYILKPIDEERLKKTLDRILKNVNLSKKFITVNSNKINTKINITNILYIEVIGNVSCIHLSSNNIVKAYITLSEIEKMLKNNPLFLRTHKSYIVNMDYIAEMNGTSFIMKNGDVVSIRKNNCKEIKQTYKRFCISKQHR